MSYILHDSSRSYFDYDYYSFLFENDLKSVIPESFLILGGLIVLIYGVIFSTEKKIIIRFC